MGPWTISYHLAGTQNFLLWAITDPDKVRRFLEALKEVTVLFAKAQFQAGADVVVLADHATGDLVSPKTYEKFLLPVHRELVQRIGGPLILHICGNCADRLRMFVEAGFDGYHFEWQVDAQEAVRVVNQEMSLVGNINNPTTLLRGTPEDVRQQVRYSVEGRRGHHRPGMRRSPPDPFTKPASNRGSCPRGVLVSAGSFSRMKDFPLAPGAVEKLWGFQIAGLEATFHGLSRFGSPVAIRLAS